MLVSTHEAPACTSDQAMPFTHFPPHSQAHSALAPVQGHSVCVSLCPSTLSPKAYGNKPQCLVVEAMCYLFLHALFSTPHTVHLKPFRLPLSAPVPALTAIPLGHSSNNRLSLQPSDSSSEATSSMKTFLIFPPPGQLFLVPLPQSFRLCFYATHLRFGKNVGKVLGNAQICTDH